MQYKNIYRKTAVQHRRQSCKSRNYMKLGFHLLSRRIYSEKPYSMSFLKRRRRETIPYGRKPSRRRPQHWGARQRIGRASSGEVHCTPPQQSQRCAAHGWAVSAGVRCTPLHNVIDVPLTAELKYSRKIGGCKPSATHGYDLRLRPPSHPPRSHSCPSGAGSSCSQAGDPSGVESFPARFRRV